MKIAWCVAALGIASSASFGQTAKVLVYFVNIRLEGHAQARGDSSSVPVGVYPVSRTLPRPVLLKRLMKELLAGPTTGEQNSGYPTALTDLKLGQVDLVRNEATVRLKGRLPLPSVMPGPRLRLQVERTLIR